MMQYSVKLDLKGRAEKISNDSGLSVGDFFRREVGCELFECVRAQRLCGGYFLMVDEEGLLREKPFINPWASWLYGYQDHGNPIVGDALVMKTVYTSDGPDIGFLDEAEADDIISKLNERRQMMVRDFRAALLMFNHDAIVEDSDNV